MQNGKSERRPHQRLDVWREAMDLVEAISLLTAVLPDFKRFGLTTQSRRAAIRGPSNIAEGAARTSRLKHPRFLSAARGSLSELHTQLQIAARLGYAKYSDETTELVNRRFSRLIALMRAIEARGATA
ncbi:MAG: four helix bundle protein [Dokdonella sp.]